jgi:hypothetical protein
MSDKEKSIDTSISGYSNIGIRLSEKQLFDLMCINTMIKTGTFDDVPVHAIILVLKVLGLLPAEMIDNKSGNHSNDNSNDDIKERFYREFGCLNN